MACTMFETRRPTSIDITKLRLEGASIYILAVSIKPQADSLTAANVKHAKNVMFVEKSNPQTHIPCTLRENIRYIRLQL